MCDVPVYDVSVYDVFDNDVSVYNVFDDISDDVSVYDVSACVMYPRVMCPHIMNHPLIFTSVISAYGVIDKM